MYKHLLVSWAPCVEPNLELVRPSSGLERWKDRRDINLSVRCKWSKDQNSNLRISKVAARDLSFRLIEITSSGEFDRDEMELALNLWRHSCQRTLHFKGWDLPRKGRNTSKRHAKPGCGPSVPWQTPRSKSPINASVDLEEGIKANLSLSFSPPSPPLSPPCPIFQLSTLSNKLHTLSF